MIVYWDASAIVKRYVSEPGSAEIQALTGEAQANGSSVLSRAEVTATFKKAVRIGKLDEKSGKPLLCRFNRDWNDLVRIRVTNPLIRHAGTLAWNHDLRGYDAMHLASAAAWQQALGHEVTVATFDLALWQAAGQIGLAACPPDLPALLKSWH